MGLYGNKFLNKQDSVDLLEVYFNEFDNIEILEVVIYDEEKMTVIRVNADM